MLMLPACSLGHHSSSSDTNGNLSESIYDDGGATDSEHIDSGGNSSEGVQDSGGSSDGEHVDSGGNSSEGVQDSGGSSDIEHADSDGDSSGGVQEDEEDSDNTCVVAFDVDGSDSIIKSQVLNVGERISKPEDPNPKITAKGEYEFLGWYYHDKEWNFETDVVQQNMTLIAKWKLVVEYTVPFLPT